MDDSALCTPLGSSARHSVHVDAQWVGGWEGAVGDDPPRLHTPPTARSVLSRGGVVGGSVMGGGSSVCSRCNTDAVCTAPT